MKYIDNKPMGTNVKKLVHMTMAKIAVGSGGGMNAAVDLFTTPGRLQEVPGKRLTSSTMHWTPSRQRRTAITPTKTTNASPIKSFVGSKNGAIRPSGGNKLKTAQSVYDSV